MNSNTKTTLIIGGIIVAIILLVLSFAPGVGWQNGGWGMMGGLGWGFMPILMILFWGLVIWGFVSLVRGSGSNNTPAAIDSALEVLKRRYARGEISKEEFEEKKKDLS